MKRISFAQNGEDILLDRVFAGRSDGFYIDVGACHPVFHSVTKFFYERGWHGVNVEPIPGTFEILASDRPRDVNLNVGLSNRDATLAFHEVPASIGYSTFSGDQARQLREWGYELIEHTVPVTTLARVCEQYAPETIDFLKIDVESHEREVLEGADWKRFRPRVVVIEATRPNTTIPCHHDWEPILLGNDYLYAAFDGLNRFYVRSEDRDLASILAVPANVMDQFETFELHDAVTGFENKVDHLQQSLNEAQHSIDSLRLSRDEAEQALREVQDRLHHSQGELDAVRIALETSNERLGQTLARLEMTEAELTQARARLELFEGWGPATVSVVRRLRRIAIHTPMVKPMLVNALSLRRQILARLHSAPE